MAFTAIPDGDIDVDSPLTTDLFTDLRDNHTFFKDLFDVTTGHTHDGVTADDGPKIPVANITFTVAFSGTISGGTGTDADPTVTRVVLEAGRLQTASIRRLVAFGKANDAGPGGGEAELGIEIEWVSATTYDINLVAINHGGGAFNIDYEVIELS